MSIQAVGWALDQDLPARPKLVLVAIANHANHTDGFCWLKAETIAREAACSPRGVFNFVGELIRNGYVRKAVRRADDGRQRANDYWILLDRQPTPWMSSARANNDADVDSDDAEPADAETAEAQDIVLPDAPRACGENDTPAGENSLQTAPGAVGPSAPVCMHKDSAEPSKTKPEESRPLARTPRNYQRPPPPPPRPVASVAGDRAEWIFVYKPSDQYDAWAAAKQRESGRKFNCETWREGRLGWFFPTLWPPKKPQPSGSELASNSELDQFAKTG